jgi:hypothetical protein
MEKTGTWSLFQRNHMKHEKSMVREHDHVICINIPGIFMKENEQ